MEFLFALMVMYLAGMGSGAMSMWLIQRGRA
ncbi:hypothetical protein LCGC14_1343750 [marine sediment metagenome]|uniref:Uncharacterized protein n=1 Tax=marine sediment metagenome TaxID=412755 RepID=A0A0F9MTS7_9ZZZZ